MAPFAIYLVAALALIGVVVRPWNAPELLWAGAGAVVLVASGLLPWADAGRAVLKGADVYLFLVGMMLLSTSAEREGLFDRLAAVCAARAHGSAPRLFLLVYAAGTVVTVFMSNDATAVVLTPAVLAICRKAEVDEPLPYLLACALIANAASFVLPISNPANLVLFGAHLPPLATWLARFLLPSALSIAATYAVLRLRFRKALAAPVASAIEVPAWTRTGAFAALGIGGTGAALLAASALGRDLGVPTLACGLATTAAILIAKRETPWPTLRSVSWSILPLVAGLFVIVEALQRAGLIELLTNGLERATAQSAAATAWAAGAAIALASNLMNNLPAGLIASSVVAAARVDPTVHSAIAIGVDLGPNLSVTGSLATILWLVALRRQQVQVSAWTFLKTGAVAMPVALVAALGGLFLQRALVAA